MPLETTPFDATDYLTTPEAIGEYLLAAEETGDPEVIENAKLVIARARKRIGTKP